jgi:hypothetical protein
MTSAPLRLVPFGPPLTRALAHEVAAAKASDPMAAVTVAVPSAHAGLTLRRALAGERGLVNVQFLALPQITELLATPAMAAQGLRLVPRLARLAAVRQAIEPTSMLAPLADDPAALLAIDRTVSELADADDQVLRVLARRGGRAAEVVQVVLRTRERLQGWADEGAVARLAVDQVHGGVAESLGLGRVVVVAPRRLRSGERDVLAALHNRGQATVLIGTTGHDVADEAAAELAAQLEPAFGPPQRAPGDVADAAGTFQAVVAPDPEEEVRLAVRRIVHALDGGTPAHRIALVSRQHEPYAQVAHDVLSDAGVAHHGDLPLRLAQSVAGRGLLALLELPAEEHSRGAVMALLRSVPLFDAEGRPAPVDDIDAVSRRSGVVAGLGEWERRLGERRADLLSRQAEAQQAVDHAGPDPDAASDTARAQEKVEGFQKAIDRVDRVGAFVLGLAEAVEVGERRSWADLAVHASGLLDTHLGGPAERARWPDAEQRAAATVHDVLEGLAELDAFDPEPGPTRFLVTLKAELDRSHGEMGRYGNGVFVGGIGSLVGADHDLVVVLGAVAGSLPARGTDDALVPDSERAVLGGTVAPRRRSAGEELRDLHAALAAAPVRLATVPRADLRSQRACLPAPWLLHQLAAHAGTPVTSSSFRHLPAPLVTEVASFESSVLEGDPPATVQEHDVAALLLAAGAGPATATALLSHPDPTLVRGLDAVRQRATGGFGPWSGEIPAEIWFDDEHLASATGLQDYATCPFSFLMGSLGLGDRDDPAEIEQLDARNRGSLIHEVLEDVVGASLDRPPDVPWGQADLVVAEASLAERRTQFEQRGQTGRPLLWRLQQEGITARVARVLAADSDRRAEEQLVPDGVEVRFGPDDTPVAIPLPDGRRLAFRGMIDRVDRPAEGGRWVLYDYKTGYENTRGSHFKALADDPVVGGRLLQLAIYAEAVRARIGLQDAEVDARYWLVDRPSQPDLPGRVYGEAERARLQEVLGQIVAGIEGGLFPRRPGEEQTFYRTWDNCGWCAFNRICPTTRGTDWEVVREDGRVATVVQLTEGPAEAAKVGEP